MHAPSGVTGDPAADRPEDGRPMRDLIASLMHWYLGALHEGGYLLIALLMAAESSILPVPSELVIPPAAYLAHAHGTFSYPGIVIAGTVGSWFGATVMYWISRLLGRPLLMRYGRYVLVTPEKIEQAENWSAHYGGMGVFVARILPVIRHLIGIPAGIVRLDYWKFSLATIAGSALWCTVLVWLGVTAGKDKLLLEGSLHRISLWGGGVLLFVWGLYYLLVHRQMRRGGPRRGGP
jgi:membrane protein DedA with SNARE-associated domain